MFNNFSEKKAITFFVFSFVYILIYEYILKGIDPIFPKADITGYIVSMLAYGYLASYMVYFLTVYIPLKRERIKNQEFISKQMGFLIKEFNEVIFLYSYHKTEKTNDLVRMEVRNYLKGPEELYIFDKKEISNLCTYIYPTRQTKTLKFILDENNNVQSVNETWGDLLFRLATKTKDTIRSLYLFSHLLDIEDIKLLNHIEFSVFIQLLENYDKGEVAIKTSNKDWSSISDDMYNYYTLLEELNKKLFPNSKRNEHVS